MKLKRGHYIAGGAIVALLTPAMCGHLMNRAERAELLDARRAADRAGLHRNIQDLLPPMPPAEENAAPLLTRAHALVAGAEISDDMRDLWNEARNFMMRRSNPWFRVRREPLAARSIVDRLAAPLALVDEAAQKPKCVFERDWDLGLAVSFPELGTIRSLGTILCVRASLKGQSGDADGMAEDLVEVVKLGKLVASEGALLDVAIGLGMQRSVLDLLTAAISESGSAQQWRDAVQKVELEMGGPADLRPMLSMLAAQTLQTLDIDDPEKAARELGYSFRGSLRKGVREDLRNQTEVKLLRLFCQVAARMPKDSSDYLSIRQVGREFGPQLDKALIDFTPFFAAAFPPDRKGEIVIAAEAAADVLTRRRLLRALIGVIDRRAEDGKTPSALPFEGENATDPFSGKPFLYRADGDSVLIYSVAHDGDDDHGARLQPDLKDGDISVWLGPRDLRGRQL